ncbi:MAG TPA: hypothetical protein VM616_04985 [Gammaproteobacteria bacterium]|nr:hypothetical protein [Gammaproteobacteria bacterium]
MTVPKTIYQFESGNTETWIVVNDDGTVTRNVENAGWTASRRGAEAQEETLSAEEAKRKWGHEKEIDAAIAELGKKAN